MHTLYVYQNQTVQAAHADEDDPAFSQSAANHYDASIDVAIDLLAAAGYTPDSLDALGEPIEGDVQTLLTLAFMRLPGLMERVQELLES